jgi:septin family protein
LRRHPAPWELGPFAVVVAATYGEEGSALPHGERLVWGVVAVGVCRVGVVRVGL